MKFLFIGAHPDDPDYRAGGLAKKYTNAGHEVRFLSLTNGDMGHHEIRGPALAERRRREAFMASGVGGLEYVIHTHRDARLLPTLEARDDLIGIIRQYKPDAIFTHRPNDYHPDHRNTSALVQDASYMLTVPAICPRVPHLRKMPVILYMEDEFKHPYPFTPDVLVSIDDVIEDKIKMLDCHKSQFYEWLPYNQGHEKEVPDEPDDRIQWLGEITRERSAKTADHFRAHLKRLYGDAKGAAVKFAEAYEVCEYGEP
ncbi:PIG-L family deacetylase, partial [Candidatus Sumerlaeota bacterium]|nr:PIG-L family deacetylase [Candidatus Sumerlaeota bacterium]